MEEQSTGEPASEQQQQPAAGPVADRIQALLSRAVEDQLSEQRQVASVIGDLRAQVTGLTQSLGTQPTASTLERLLALVGELAARVDAVAVRVDERARSGLAGGDETRRRLTALADEVGTQARSVTSLRVAVEALTSFPTALAAVQQDLAGLHDRLAPLADLRLAVQEIGDRSDSDTLRPLLDALARRLDALPTTRDLSRSRDDVVQALEGRFEDVTAVTDRPSVGPEALEAALQPLAGGLSALMPAAALAERLASLDDRLDALERQLAALPGSAPAAALEELTAQVRRLAADVGQLPGVARLVEASAAAEAEVGRGLAEVRHEVESLGARLQALHPPSVPELAAGLGPSLSGPLADALVVRLAPELAEVVLAQVAPLLVDRVSEEVTRRVLGGLTESVHSAGTETSRRVTEHVDEAVLALAEALLRRGRGRPVGGLGPGEPPPVAGRHAAEPEPEAPVAAPPAAVPAEPEPAAPVPEPAPLPPEPGPAPGTETGPPPRRRPWWRPGG